MVEMIRKNIVTAEKIGCRALGYIKRNWKTIIYYIALSAVLMLIAFAAEKYRHRDAPVEEAAAIILPETAHTEPEKAPGFDFAIPNDAQRIQSLNSEPRWNDQLEQWEIHKGEDYTFPEDMAMAFSNGTVEYVSLEEGCVGVRSGSIYLLYKSVEPDSSLKTGDEIRQGEKIGICTDTLRGEGHMGKHLHLEASIDGSPVDFESIAE